MWGVFLNLLPSSLSHQFPNMDSRISFDNQIIAVSRNNSHKRGRLWLTTRQAVADYRRSIE